MGLLTPITQREELGMENVVKKDLPYLKVPQKFRDEFGSPVHYPEPRIVSKSESHDTVFLIYEFPKTEMDKLRKKKKEVKKDES